MLQIKTDSSCLNKFFSNFCCDKIIPIEKAISRKSVIAYWKHTKICVFHIRNFIVLGKKFKVKLHKQTGKIRYIVSHNERASPLINVHNVKGHPQGQINKSTRTNTKQRTLLIAEIHGQSMKRKHGKVKYGKSVINNKE